MAYGIYAQPVGPGPATPAPLFIDSNLTFPQFLGTYSFNPSWSQTSLTFTVSSFDGQGTLVVVPNISMITDYLDSPEIIPSFNYITGVSISGQNVTVSISAAGASGNNRHNFPISFNAYKIWPTGDQSYGITFSNSTNFFAISDSGVVGQCVWAYRGSISDGFKVPNANANSLVFANWNQSGVTASYDSTSQQMIICANRSNFSGSNRGGTISDMRVAVFNNGLAVPEHNGGLNIYSPNGQTCVFSSYRSPFAISRFFPSSGGATGLSIPMLCMNRSQGAITDRNGGWMWVHDRSFTMTGGSVGTGFGPIITSWTDQYPITININVGFNYPMIEGTNLYA